MLKNRKIAPKNKNQDKLDIEKLFHIDSIPIEELEDQYIDLSSIVSSSGYGGRFMGTNGKILKEEALSTLSIDETKSQIKDKFQLKDWQFATKNGKNGIELVVLYPGIFKNTKLIKDAMLACGWSVATTGYIFKHMMLWRVISFDPIFQDDVYSEARQYDYLFHWTPLYNYQSILKDGLIPKSENKYFDYPDRLHFIKGNASMQEVYNIGQQLCASNKKYKNNGDYILLGIDMSKLPREIEIFYDPRYECGYYTKESIPSSSIIPLIGYNFKHKQKITI